MLRWMNNEKMQGFQSKSLLVVSSEFRDYFGFFGCVVEYYTYK